MSRERWEENDPEVIAAKAEAEARILEARANLSSTAQTVYAIFDSIGGIVTILFWFFIILVVVLSCIAPQILPKLFGQ